MSSESTLIVAALLRTLVLDIFGEQDAARRALAIESAFATDCVFTDPQAKHFGRAAIDPAVRALQARFPGFVFRLTSEPEVIEDAGRVTWGFGPPGQAPRVTGMDVITVREGQITQLLTFLDLVAQQNPKDK
jgi:hypothetical protein